MSAQSESEKPAGPAAAPRDNPRHAISLLALEQTRQGLKLAAPGALFLLFSVPWIEMPSMPVLVVAAVRMLGWLLLGLGLLLTAATPNGPLPRWLKLGFVSACFLGALQAGLGPTGWLPPMPTIGPHLVRAVQIGFLLLPWILWRFCQQRGLTGRAISWLWAALALLIVGGAYTYSRSSWLLWIFPALAVGIFFLAQQTARDVWLDAVHKASRRATAQRAG